MSDEMPESLREAMRRILENRMFVLRDRVPVQASSLLEWTLNFREAEPHIADDYVQVGEETVRVSTIFTGYNLSPFDETPPTVFETMVFGGKNHHWRNTYQLYGQAEEGHKAALAWVKGLAGEPE